MTSTLSNLSKLSKSDRNCIEFTRCLYKAKLVVQELEELNQTVGPSLYLSSSKHDPSINKDELTRHFYQYLNDSLRKLNNMCRVLLIVLEKLELNHPIKKERINSFRQEVLDEWKKAERLEQELLYSLQNQSSRDSLPSPSSDLDHEED